MYNDYALIKKSTLTDIGDAIRTKKGISNLIDPADFSSEIESIEGGTIVEGHSEVDSIITDGLSYINTYICPNPNYSIEMEFKVHTNELETFDCIFGTRKGDYARWTARFDATENSIFRVCRSQTSDVISEWYHSTLKKEDFEDYVVFKLEKNLVYINGELQYTFTISDAADIDHCPFPLYLFAVNEKNDLSTLTNNCGYFNVRYVKLWDEKDNLILDLIPVVKNDGTVCMYNKVNSAYYYNAGTGTFTYSGESEEPAVTMEDAIYEYYGIDKEEYPYLYISSWYNSSKNWRIKPIFCKSVDNETGVLTDVLGIQSATTKTLTDDEYNNTVYYNDINMVFDYMKESNIVFDNSYESYQSDNLTDKCMYYTNWNATYYTNWADLRTL